MKLGLGALLLLVTACSGAPTTDIPDALEHELEAIEQKILSHELAIADCMAERGFEYIAELPPDWFAERALMIAVETNDPDPEARRLEAFDEALEQPSANQVLYEALSLAAREAYQAALGGDPSRDTVGCFDLTYETVWGPDNVALDDVTNDSLLAGDSRAVDALGDFERCMAESGYQVEGLSGIFQWLDGERARLMSSAELSETEAIDAYQAIEQPAREVYRECHATYMEVIDKIIVDLRSDQ